MPRTPFFNQSVRSQQIIHTPDRVPGFLENPGNLGSAIGKAVGGLFYKAENDPRAQQARLYRAQAEGQVLENQGLQRKQGAALGLPELVASLTGTPTNRYDTRPEPLPEEDEDLSPIMSALAPTGEEATELGEIEVIGRRGPDNRLTEAQHKEADQQDRDAALRQGYASLIRNGIEAKEAQTMIAGIAAGWGMDDSVIRMNGAHGDFIGKDESVSLGGQHAIRLTNFEQEAKINDADNRTAVQMNDADNVTSRLNNTDDNRTSRANAGTSAGATITSARIGANQRDTANIRDNRTSRDNNFADNFAGSMNNSADNAQADRNNRRTTSARVAVAGGKGNAPARSAPARSAPADPLNIR